MKKTYFIVNHYMVYGAGQALRDYFFKKKIEFVYVSSPLENKDLNYCVKIFKKNKLKKIYYKNFFPKTFKILFDVLFVVYASIIYANRNDIFIGINPLNFFFGRLLKNFDKKIFYTIDFSKDRYKNFFINYLYHKIEKKCFNSSDINWNVSKKIKNARLKYFKINTYKNTDLVVPIGTWKTKKKFIQRKNYQLVFLGHLLKKQGLELVLSSLKIVKKKFKNIKLFVIGGGPELKNLIKISKHLGLMKNIIFKGWIYKTKEIHSILNKSNFAFATYIKKDISFTQYSDPTKIKDYLSCGLPIIATDTFHNAAELKKKNCLILLEKENAVHLSKIIINALVNQKKINQMRKNCYMYISNYNWAKIFKKALEKSNI
jgi:glycosyltransferase involved in cell wall biosynthesis